MSNAIDCAYTITGEGEPLFLIHGIGAARNAWDGIVMELKDDFQCITYDLRGHGVSPMPEGRFTLDDLVEDLEVLREKLGLDHAHFSGHSLGGMIGPAYARKYPNRVKTLGLLSTAAGRTAEDSSKVIGVVEAMEKKGIENVLPALKNRWFTDDFITKNPERIEARIQQVLDTDVSVFMNVFRIYAEFEMGPWLHEINMPSLVLTGEFDGGCNPRLNEFIHDELPQSELVILESFKHSLLAEAPKQVAQHTRDFIRRHSEQNC